MNIKDYFHLDKDVDIKNIMTDSRAKLLDAIFFAIVGLRNDGHDYIKQAINNGAKCIVISSDVDEVENITYIKVDDTLKSLNDFCDYFYGYPSHKMTVFGVTGTNGKTTISYLLYTLINEFSKCGYSGTLGYGYDDDFKDHYFTTPEPNTFHKIMKEMYEGGCKYVSCEVSSQGLDLHRADSVDFDVAMYTNLTHEHLDYHLNFENYYNAKARLFKNIKKDGVAIINNDDPYAHRLINDCNCKVLTYGIDSDADYKAINLKLEADHSSFELVTKDSSYLVKTNLVAKYNISNLLCVIAALDATGFKLEEIIPYLENVKLVPGRMEVIDEKQNFKVLVDYAHTPDGFLKIFEYAKMITPKTSKIRVVFGMRGSGDIDKRKVVGEIADNNADEIIITADDNHYENVFNILDDIEKGIKKHKAVRFEERVDALKYAINNCEENDTLLILGKGEDKYNKINGKIYPYDGDNVIARRLIKEKNNK